MLKGVILGCIVLTLGCRQDMHDQPKFKTYRADPFFADGRSARPLVAGTVARGNLQADEHLYQGKENGGPAKNFPFPITEQVLLRGQERFNIYCSPCHSQLGDGQGMIVQRGLKQPPSFHIERLREAPVGYFFTVITSGFGVMYDYSDRVAPEDRWAIIAYIRALQLSQHATLQDVPAEERQKLTGSH
ncbi:MAG: cytochrome c [Candidatus Binatia bacterium]